MVNFFGSSSSPKQGKKKGINVSDSQLLSFDAPPNLGKSSSYENNDSSSSDDDHDDNDSHQVPSSARSLTFPLTARDDKTLKKELKQKRQKNKVSNHPSAQRATERRRNVLLSRKVKVVLNEENDFIQECLAVDDDGYCLRHDDQLVKSGLVKAPHRFESIRTCRSCAFGSECGIKHRNHGQKAHPVAHAVNGALKATKIKKKKKKMKGAFDTRTTENSNDQYDGNNSLSSEMDFSTAMRGSEKELTSEHALLPPSMSADDNSATDATILPADVLWNEEVMIRVLQVVGWDNNKVPLKCHPLYAKYFRMLRKGIPPGEIRESFGEDGPDLLLLSLDPNKAFEDQLDGLSPHVQERLRASGALTANTDGEPTEITQKVYQAYLKQRELFDQFRKEEEMGISNIVKEKEKGIVDRNGMQPVPGGKKKKKLRIKKKFKRIVKAGKSKDGEADGGTSDSEEEIEVSESIVGDEDINPAPVIRPGGASPMQPLPSAGLRRARRPNARRPGAQRSPRRAQEDKGVVQTNGSESPKSSISPSPNGRRGRRPISPKKMEDLIMSSNQPLESNAETPAGVRQRKAAASSAIRNKQSRQRSQTAPVAAAAVARNRENQQRTANESKTAPSTPSTPPRDSDAVMSSQRSILKTPESHENVVLVPDKNEDSIDSNVPPPLVPEQKEETKESIASLAAPDRNEETKVQSLPIPTPPITKESRASSLPATSDTTAAPDSTAAAPDRQDDYYDTTLRLGPERKPSNQSLPVTIGAESIANSEMIQEPPPLQSFHASHVSVMSKLSSCSTAATDGEKRGDAAANEEAVDVEKFTQVFDDLLMTKEELDQARMLLSHAKKRENELKGSMKEKDKRISKLLKTVGSLQQTIKDMGITTKSPTRSQSRSPRMEVIASPRGSLKNKKAFLLKQQLLGKHSVYCYFCACYSCHCMETEAKLPDAPVLSKQGRDSKSAGVLNEEDMSSPWDEMKPRKERSSGGGRITVYLGSGAVSSGEDISYGFLNDDEPQIPLSASRMSSKSLEPPGPPTIQRDEYGPGNAQFDTPGTPATTRASNVREITPHTRRRVKSIRPEEEQKFSGIADSSLPNGTAVTKKKEESIIDKKRKKRELEERLRKSITRATSGDLDDLYTAAKGKGRRNRSDSADESEEEI